MDKNDFTENQISSIIKFTKATIIKITFNKTDTAKNTTESGLRMSIPPHHIRQDTFHSIKMCLRCYEMETHTKAECPN